MKVGDHTLRECERCGGLWVSRFAFQQICTREEQQEAVLGFEAVVEQGSAATKPAPVRVYIPCPECGKLMNRQQFAGCSRIILDWCKEHGAWCDRNELHRIVRFIRDGGLKKSREREKQKIEDEKARLREHQMGLSALSLHPNEGAYITSGWKEDSDPLLRILSSAWLDLNK
jgi:Zn-finger nucleic acid-binding protein